jgi:hypothetical protein
VRRAAVKRSCSALAWRTSTPDGIGGWRGRPGGDVLSDWDIRDLVYELGMPAIALQAGLEEFAMF